MQIPNETDKTRTPPTSPFGNSLANEVQTAEALDVAPNTLAKWRITGEGPPFLKIGRSVRYDPADVQQWLASRKVRSTSERAA
ncbi:helix-turn-helix transcriptional regulator [Novosphingobium marinum]|uniref:Putative DNA-binding transcriptional regulator AlpA n=1 Tax=Novosphingobium marinum TaxID=1514948 RepID=A0A7Z0BSY9_9SPHN|nr:helix-turn-helix domain-containing protein [Novosphingobium marinum]NYH95421.1 putative DNA-binding transcriptional regulator AlpA [Novosphingobium marinum]